MQVFESTLLAGPYDWDPALIPRAEFEARITRARAVLAGRTLAGLIVAGNAPEQGGLCWLTNYVPKMLPSMALLGADGTIHVRCSGRGSMRDAAQRLTWVEGVTPIKTPATEVEEWAKGSGIGPGALVGLWGGDHVPNAFHKAICAGATAVGATLVPMDAELDPLRARKSEVELRLLRRSAALLETAIASIRDHHARGAGARSAVLAGERAAYENGAQDVRLLVSLSEGAVPRPLEGPADPRVGTMLGCVMVRFAGYWAEGLFTLSTRPLRAAEVAQARLDSMLAAARPGITAADLQRGIEPDGYQTHPMVLAAPCNGIGLSRVEHPFLAEGMALEEGQTYVLRAGVVGQDGDNAVTSAMFVLRSGQPEILIRA